MSTGEASTPDRRLKALFAGLALALGLLTLEIGCRLLLPAPPFPERQPQILYQPDSDVGFVHVPGQRGWIDDGFVTINSMGFRGAEWESTKTPGTCRVLALGDSTTVGWGVDDSATYPVQLGKLLEERYPARRFEIVNLAVSGHNGETAVRVLRKFAPLLDPDLVLVGLSWNDFQFAPLEANRSSGLDAGSSSDVRQAKPFRLVGAQSELHLILRRSRAVYALSRVLVQLQYAFGRRPEQLEWETALLEGDRSEPLRRAWSRVESTLRETKVLADRRQIPLEVVVMPFRAQLRGGDSAASYQASLAEICQRVGVETIDPLPAFIDQRHRVNELFIPYDRSHPAAAGYGLIAEAAADSVARLCSAGGVRAQPPTG